MHPFQRRFLFLLAIGLSLSACRKDQNPAPLETRDLLLTKKVTTFYSDFPSGQQLPIDSTQPVTYQNTTFYRLTRRQDTYQYDDQKRVTSFSARNPDRPDYSYEWYDASYAYTGNKMIYTNLRTSPLMPYAYALNDRGYVTERNKYDKEGYLVYRQEGPGATTTQTISGGNIVKKVYQDSNSRLTLIYEYDLSRSGLPAPEVAMWGRPSRNLVVRATSTNESFSGVGPIMPDHSVINFTYLFDSRGIVKQQTAYTQKSLMPNPAIVDRDLEVSVFEFK